MRNIWFAATLLLAACATDPNAPDLQPEHKTKFMCRDEPGKAFIGKTVSEALGLAILRATNSEVLRWAPPHTYQTEDWHPWRVTVYYEADGRVRQVSCG